MLTMRNDLLGKELGNMSAGVNIVATNLYTDFCFLCSDLRTTVYIWTTGDDEGPENTSELSCFRFPEQFHCDSSCFCCPDGEN